MMREKIPEKKKKKIWIVLMAVCAIVIISGGVLVYEGFQQKQAIAAVLDEASDEETVEDVEADYVGEENDFGTVSWNGKKYTYNDHLSNYLFLGIDNREMTDTTMGHRDAGQSDAIFLLSWDRVEGDMTLISIPRDTMTDIEYFNQDGSSLGTTKSHLNLAYAYGDGKHESARLSVQAVSYLFYGLPIQGYCAMNMDVFPILTESIGGLEVIVPNDSLKKRDPDYYEGAVIELGADNTELFVRYRDTGVTQSALMRLERQQVFLEAYAEKVKKLASEDAGIITEIYSSLQPYMITNIGNDQFMKLSESFIRGAGIMQWTVPGEGVEGNQYDEYYVDDKALYGKIIETFYEEKE